MEQKSRNRSMSKGTKFCESCGASLDESMAAQPSVVPLAAPKHAPAPGKIQDTAIPQQLPQSSKIPDLKKPLPTMTLELSVSSSLSFWLWEHTLLFCQCFLVLALLKKVEEVHLVLWSRLLLHLPVPYRVHPSLAFPPLWRERSSLDLPRYHLPTWKWTSRLNVIQYPVS